MPKVNTVLSLLNPEMVFLSQNLYRNNMQRKHLWIITYRSKIEYRIAWNNRFKQKGWTVNWIDTDLDNEYYEFSGYHLATRKILKDPYFDTLNIITNDTWLTRRATEVWYSVFNQWAKSIESGVGQFGTNDKIVGDVHQYPEKSILKGFKLISSWCFALRNREGAVLLEEALGAIKWKFHEGQQGISQQMEQAIDEYLNHPKRPFYGYAGPWTPENVARKASTIRLEYLLSEELKGEVYSWHSAFPITSGLGRLIDRLLNKWRALIHFYLKFRTTK